MVEFGDADSGASARAFDMENPKMAEIIHQIVFSEKMSCFVLFMGLNVCELIVDFTGYSPATDFFNNLPET